MDDARDDDAWYHTAMVSVLLANPHRDVKKRSRPYEIDDFHPRLWAAKQKAKHAGRLSRIFSVWSLYDGQEPQLVTETTWQNDPQT
jgi:hypothetical protein